MKYINLKIKFVTVDEWDRAVYKTEKGTLLKDTEHLFNKTIHTPLLSNLCTCDSIEGEPDIPLMYTSLSHYSKCVLVNKFEKVKEA